MPRDNNKPRVHARDHEHGGADEHRIHYEDLNDSGATTLTSRASQIRWGDGISATDLGQGVVLINGTAGGNTTFKGHKPTHGDLPGSGNTTGDTWIVDDTDTAWIWDGTDWVNVSGHDVPPGGGIGQVLTKSSDTDWDTTWSAAGGRYVSVQDGVFHASSGIDLEITNWPRIVIPVAEWDANVAATYGMFAQWQVEAKPVFGSFYRVDMQPMSNDLQDANDGNDPISDDGWITLAAQGTWLDPGSGAPTLSPVETWMRYQSGGDVDFRNGILVMYWTDAVGVPISFYLGNWPALNSDVAANAAIDPTKLNHPGGTDQFLRSDGTWSNQVLEVDY